MVAKKKVVTKKRQSADPWINHVKRAVKKVTSNPGVRGAVTLGKLVIPGVGGSSLTRYAEKKLRKALTGK